MKIAPYENLYYRLSDGKPYLLGSKCRNCGYVAFPKKVDCPSCVTKESMKETELSRDGKIDTFSVIHVAPPGFTAPYILAYVLLPERVRILSMINCCELSNESLRIGADVELTLGKIREDENGNEVVGYKFTPVFQEEQRGN